MQTKAISFNHKTLALILSGGAGSRFAGADKGLQFYRGKPLIVRVINIIRPQVDDLLICINRNEMEYKKLGYPTVFDHDQDFQGPIAGILAAFDYLEHAGNLSMFNDVLISSCDSPSLPLDYVTTLTMHAAQSELPVAVVNDGVRNQNLHCLIKRCAWASLADFYAHGGRAMHRWHKKVGALEVDFSNQADCFLNINRPEQLD